MTCDPHDGLTLEDLAWAYPPMSQCAPLGHPLVRLPDPARFADSSYCICRKYFVDGLGVRRLNREPVDSL